MSTSFKTIGLVLGPVRDFTRKHPRVTLGTFFFVSFLTAQARRWNSAKIQGADAPMRDGAIGLVESDSAGTGVPPGFHTRETLRKTSTIARRFFERAEQSASAKADIAGTGRSKTKTRTERTAARKNIAVERDGVRPITVSDGGLRFRRREL